jgi:hypothetical protein
MLISIILTYNITYNYMLSKYIQKQHDVKTQFGSTAERQCSWFAHLVANELQTLLNFFDGDTFVSIYNDIISKASDLKNRSKTCGDIETICSPQILAISNRKWKFYHCIVDEDKEDIFGMLAEYPNYDEIKRTKMGYPKITIDDIVERVLSIGEKVPVLINRYFMSFVMVKYNKKFIIFDSHYNICGNIKPEDIKNYILYDDYQQNLITVGFPQSHSKCRKAQKFSMSTELNILLN